MQKRTVAIALCLVTISAFAVTSAVSAYANNAAIKQFNIPNQLLKDSGTVYGKLTIDTNSGHCTVNMNWAKLKPVFSDSKSNAKDDFRQTQYNFGFSLTNVKTHEELRLGWLALTNNGENVHGEGTLDPTVVSSEDLVKNAVWNPNDVSVGPMIKSVP